MIRSRILAVILFIFILAPRPAFPLEESGPFWQNSPVTILVTSWCAYCKALERFLEEKGVKFRRLDIEHDPLGISAYSQIGEPGVPVVFVGPKMFKGYVPDAIMREIKKNSLQQNNT